MDPILEWLRKALADPKLTALRRLLSRRDLSTEVRTSVKAYIEADEQLEGKLRRAGRSPDRLLSMRRAALHGEPRGPFFSASFVDYVDEKDPPIRFERGDPLIGGKQPRAIDRMTGEYMTTRSIHWQNPTRDYVLFCADGTEQSVSTVEQEVVDVQGDGKVGLYKVRVLHIMEVAIGGSRSEIAELPDSYAERLADFIAALLLDHAPARRSAEITFDLGGEVRSW